MESQKQAVSDMVHKYIESVELTRTQVFNEAKNVWTWKKGSATIQVYI
jgi:hypothetical protein